MAALGFAVRSCDPHFTGPSYRNSEVHEDIIGAELHGSLEERGFGGYRTGWEAGREGPWSGWRGVKSWEEKEGWMSKHTSVQGSGSSSADDCNQSIARSAGTRSALMQAQSALPKSFQVQSGDASSEKPPTLPPVSRASSMADDASDQPRQGRVFGVHSILNPLQADAQEPRGLRRKADDLEQSSPSIEPASTRPESLASAAPSRTGSGDVSPASSQTGYNAFPGLPQRPRSKVPRLASLSTLKTPTATLPVQDNPFLAQAGPNSTTESIPSQPPLPTPPTVAARQGYGFPSAPTPPISESRRMSGDMPGPIQPSSGSPSTQVSAYSQVSRTSPAMLLGMSTEQGRSPYYPPSSDASGVPPSDRERTPGIPVSSTGHSSYQLMTFNTAQGAVQFPVDVQAASRAADDKRRRNAGASARFRARRKEKEREASTTISRLERHLKDAREDAEFYRRERDYLGSVLLQAQGGDQHFPRPSSPRHRRDPDSSESGGGSGSGSYASPFQSQRHPSLPLREQGPGSASYSPTAATSAVVPRANYQSAYPPLPDPARHPGSVARGMPPATQPLPPLQQHQQPPLHRPTPPPGLNRTPSYDLYRTESHDRSWPLGPGPGRR